MSKTIIALITIGGVLVTALAFGSCRRNHCRVSPEKKVDYAAKRIASELDLTDAQKTRLDLMKAEIVAKMKEHRKDRAEQHKKIIDLVISDELDRGNLEKIADQKHAKMQELRPFVIDKIIEFHKMLTPEQRQKLAEKIDKFHSECGK